MTDDRPTAPPRDPTALEIVCEAVGEDGALCRITGTLTADSLHQAGDGLDITLRTGARLLVLDLARILVCDASCFDHLLRLREDAVAAGVEIRLSAASPAVERVLDETGRRSDFAVFESVADALNGSPPAPGCPVVPGRPG
ncbi:STAS domain-containing protein [Kitasatospora sp. NPDC051914]|uniref:STAS domain-containing protein n=1 Tax=Kitasatospora sp. NPDC051914 TaxID=3154945 RepID=UPI003448DDCB